MFGLNIERSIWIEQEDLGKEIVLKHNNKRYVVKIPSKIDTNVIIRLRGLGKTRRSQTGDLLLHVWLNKGEDIKKDLWLSETSARTGLKKILALQEKKIQLTIPPKSYDGLIIRLRGLGRKTGFAWRAPFLHRKKGNLLVKLIIYPESITPKYASFETLTTDDMAMEGWVYQMKDKIIRIMGESTFNVVPIKAAAIADSYNNCGWLGIFYDLVLHLKLSRYNIKVDSSGSIAAPGCCRKLVTLQNNTPVESNYTITINAHFLDNPFAVAAILAHELCHVICSERIDNKSRVTAFDSDGIKLDSLEEERVVDLLVFMFKLGEFQLRVARDKRLTLGYFNQEIFDRIQVIASRK